MARWKRDHQERITDQRRAWRAKHLVKIREYGRKWVARKRLRERLKEKTND